jgi:hypothetical protein
MTSQMPALIVLRDSITFLDGITNNIHGNSTDTRTDTRAASLCNFKPNEVLIFGIDKLAEMKREGAAHQFHQITHHVSDAVILRLSRITVKCR